MKIMNSQSWFKITINVLELKVQNIDFLNVYILGRRVVPECADLILKHRCIYGEDFRDKASPVAALVPSPGWRVLWLKPAVDSGAQESVCSLSQRAGEHAVWLVSVKPDKPLLLCIKHQYSKVSRYE